MPDGAPLGKSESIFYFIKGDPGEGFDFRILFGDARVARKGSKEQYYRFEDVGIFDKI